MSTLELKPGMIPLTVTPITADDTTPAMYITCVNASATSATVAVTVSTGDITLSINGAVDPLIDSGAASGGSSDPGVIDVSDTGFTTFGAVADYINKSANWRCRLSGVLRSDLTGAPNGIAVSAANAIGAEVAVLLDTSVLLTATLYNQSIAAGHGTLLGPVDRGWRTVLTRIEGIGTSNGTLALNVYSVNPLTGSEKVLFYALPVTATAFEFNDVDFGATGGIYSLPGEYLLVRYTATTSAITSSRLQIQGYVEPLGATAPQTAFISKMS